MGCYLLGRKVAASGGRRRRATTHPHASFRHVTCSFAGQHCHHSNNTATSAQHLSNKWNATAWIHRSEGGETSATERSAPARHVVRMVRLDTARVCTQRSSSHLLHTGLMLMREHEAEIGRVRRDSNQDQHQASVTNVCSATS